MDDATLRRKPATYDGDVVAWATEQATLIRAGQFDLLDLQHIADEIEDVGKSEQRELASRMGVLLAHLLKWQFQPARRGASWRATVAIQRKRIALALKTTPSLKTTLRSRDWQAEMWLSALQQAVTETGLDLSAFPQSCPWSLTDQVLRDGWLPN